MAEKTVICGTIQGHSCRKPGYIVFDKETGIIETVGSGSYTTAASEEVVYFNDKYTILPADINGHSHPEQSIYTDVVKPEWDLPLWCRNTIYKYSPYLTPQAVYYSCLRAFSRMLAYGIGTVFVSFYCHNKLGNAMDLQVIKAAKDIGIRLYFGRMNYDIISENAYYEKKLSQTYFFEDYETAARNYMSLLSESTDHIIVAPSVHSLHASTPAAVKKAYELAAITDTYIQFHLSEDKNDVDISLSNFGERPVAFFKKNFADHRIQALKKFIFSDCIWLDEEEISVLKEAGCTVVFNPRMNYRMRVGRAPYESFIEKSIPFLLGTDGESSNHDLSIENEKGFFVSQLNLPVKHYQQKFPFGCAYVGSIEPGCFCDLKVKKDGKVTDVFVGGKRVFSEETFVSADSKKVETLEKEASSEIKNFFLYADKKIQEGN